MPNPRTSPRAPLLWLLLPFMAGIALGDWPAAAGAPLPLVGGLAIAAGAGAFLAAGRSGRWAAWRWAGWLALAAAGSGLMARALGTPRRGFDLPAPREVVIVAEIEQVFAAGPKARAQGGLARVRAAEAHLAGLVGARLYFSALRRTSLPPVRGGQYEVRGVLERLAPGGSTGGFGQFLAASGVELTLTRAVVARPTAPPAAFDRICAGWLRRWETCLRRGLERHPAETALYLAMVLGQTAGLDKERQGAFMRSGTYHIFSISGLHVGVVATAVQALFALLRVPRRVAAAASLGTLLVYVHVTGASTPAQRALLMVALFICAQVGRLPANALAALTAAALLSLLCDPLQLFNPGFQMSYAVVTALVLMAPVLAERAAERWRPWRDLPPADWGFWRRTADDAGRTFGTALGATWVALLASVPNSIGNFGLVSPGALAANLAVIPLSSFAIIAGLCSLLGGLAGLDGVSLIFNHAGLVCLRVLDRLVTLADGLPGLSFPARFREPWMASAALIAVMAAFLAGAQVRWSRRLGAVFWPPLVVLGLLILGVKFG